MATAGVEGVVAVLPWPLSARANNAPTLIHTLAIFGGRPPDLLEGFDRLIENGMTLAVGPDLSVEGAELFGAKLFTFESITRETDHVP